MLVHPEGRRPSALLTSMLRTLGCQIEEASDDRVAVGDMLDQAPVDARSARGLRARRPGGPGAAGLPPPEAPDGALRAAVRGAGIRERARGVEQGAASVLPYPLPANRPEGGRRAVSLGLDRTGPGGGAGRPTAGRPARRTPSPRSRRGPNAPAHAPTGGPAAAAPPEFAEVVGQDPKLRQAPRAELAPPEAVGGPPRARRRGDHAA